MKNAEEHQPIHAQEQGDTTGSNWIYMIYHRQDIFVCPERIYPQHGHQNGETENQGNLETNPISFGSCSRSVSKIRQKKHHLIDQDYSDYRLVSSHSCIIIFISCLTHVRTSVMNQMVISTFMSLTCYPREIDFQIN